MESTEVKSYTEQLTLKIKPLGDDSPLPNLYERGFVNTYPYNYKDDFKAAVQEHKFNAMVIENEYLKATVIPELGIRLFALYDKLEKKHVFNITDVICFSPIALRGAFLPIGLLFNFPQGHSVHGAEYIPSEFIKQDDTKGIVMHVFNAVTRIATDVEIMLKPAERRLITRISFDNTLPVRNGFMYWANAAVESTPELTFQVKAPMSFFFTDYNTFPYIDGIDFRIAKNRYFPSDMFAIGSQEDWFGFYSPEKGHGCVHISPLSQMLGKKFYSWGTNEYGLRWCRHYGCTGYGYVEFQAGILETQFEHLHMEPFEKRVVDEIWFPYSQMGNVSHADNNFIFSSQRQSLCVTSSRAFENLRFEVLSGKKQKITILDSIQPGNNVDLSVPKGFDPESYNIKVYDADGKVLIEKNVRPQMPATSEQIDRKQLQFDLKPVDDQSILEVAFRFYKARYFNKAEQLAKTITSGPLAKGTSHLLAEINYIKNNLEETAKWASKADETIRKLVEFPCKHLTKRADMSWERLKYLGLFGTIAELDALVESGNLEDALSISQSYIKNAKEISANIYYVFGYLQATTEKDLQKAREMFRKANSMTLEYVNPFTKLEMKALEYACKLNEHDAASRYLLGNYWSRLDEKKATRHWHKAVNLDPNNYLAVRNLAYITMRQRENITRAVELYEQALSVKPYCPNLIVEYVTALRLNSDLLKAMEYVDRLESPLADDYRIIKVRAYIYRDNHRFQEAIDLLLSCDHMHVWEGEVDHHRCYLECLMALGNQALADGDYDAASKYFEAMLDHPEQLVRSKAHDENESAAYYHLGLLYEKMGDSSKSVKYYQTAVNQPYPHIWHWVSYRENEYYAALAARKIADQKAYENIVKRLLAVYAEDYSAAGIDFTPIRCLYKDHLAAARGFMLTGQTEKVAECLENIKKTYGKCWPLEQAKLDLAAVRNGMLHKG